MNTFDLLQLCSSVDNFTERENLHQTLMFTVKCVVCDLNRCQNCDVFDGTYLEKSLLKLCIYAAVKVGNRLLYEPVDSVILGVNESHEYRS